MKDVTRIIRKVVGEKVSANIGLLLFFAWQAYLP
ncbi:MAG: hypothetical protein ACJAWF_000330 [Candidatus Azotimanducaceae bacterium]